MKKTLLTLLSIASINSFALDAESKESNINIHKLECHCEKHQMIFEIKDDESISEMAKHCLINQNKTHSMVKFLDDNSKKTVKCDVKNGKLVLKSCETFSHVNQNNYSRSSKMSKNTYNAVSSVNN